MLAFVIKCLMSGKWVEKMQKWFISWEVSRVVETVS